MKNMMKKLTALTIAMLLLLSLAQVASAEDAIENAPAEVIVATPTPAPQKTPAPAKEAPATAAPATEAPATDAPVVVVTNPPEATDEPTQPEDPTQAPAEADPTQTPEEEPTETPEEEEEVDPTQEPAADPTQEPQRSVYVVLYGDPGSFKYGQTVTMEAMMSGFENTSYKITWQYSQNGIDEWTTAKGSNGGTVYRFDLDKENCMYYWRVVVDIF